MAERSAFEQPHFLASERVNLSFRNSQIPSYPLFKKLILSARHSSAKVKEIINEVRGLGFKQRYLEWKLKVSKDKKYKAGIEVEMLSEEAGIFIIFYTADDKIFKRIKLISVRPARFFILPLMGKAIWVNNTEFELVDKKKEIHFRASLLKGAAEVYFTPINRDANKVIDDLLILSASTSDKQALSLLQEKVNHQP